MTDILVIFHLIGLMIAVTGSLGGTVVLALAKPAQKQKGGPLRGVGPTFAHLSDIRTGPSVAVGHRNDGDRRRTRWRIPPCSG